MPVVDTYQIQILWVQMWIAKEIMLLAIVPIQLHRVWRWCINGVWDRVKPQIDPVIAIVELFLSHTSVWILIAGRRLCFDGRQKWHDRRENSPDLHFHAFLRRIRYPEVSKIRDLQSFMIDPFGRIGWSLEIGMYPSENLLVLHTEYYLWYVIMSTIR